VGSHRVPLLTIPITTMTTTTTSSNVHQFMAISIYGYCLSLPADGHCLILVPLRPLLPGYFANKHQNYTSKITHITACSFIDFLDPVTCLLPSIPHCLHHKLAAHTPANQHIFTQVSIMIHDNAYQLYHPILLAHKYALLHVSFLHVSLRIHDYIYQL
jgi:hypothetical protein